MKPGSILNLVCREEYEELAGEPYVLKTYLHNFTGKLVDGELYLKSAVLEFHPTIKRERFAIDADGSWKPLSWVADFVAPSRVNRS